MLNWIFFFLALFNVYNFFIPLLLLSIPYFHINPPKSEEIEKELFFPLLFLLIGFITSSSSDISTAVLYSSYLAAKSVFSKNE